MGCRGHRNALQTPAPEPLDTAQMSAPSRVDYDAGRRRVKASVDTRWTPQNRPLIDTSKPAITAGRPKPVEFYFIASSVRKSVWSFGAPAARPALEHMAVMQQAIEHRGDGGGVAEQLAPIVDGALEVSSVVGGARSAETVRRFLAACGQLPL